MREAEGFTSPESAWNSDFPTLDLKGLSVTLNHSVSGVLLQQHQGGKGRNIRMSKPQARRKVSPIVIKLVL